MQLPEAGKSNAVSHLMKIRENLFCSLGYNETVWRHENFLLRKLVGCCLHPPQLCPYQNRDPPNSTARFAIASRVRRVVPLVSGASMWKAPLGTRARQVTSRSLPHASVVGLLYHSSSCRTTAQGEVRPSDASDRHCIADSSRVEKELNCN